MKVEGGNQAPAPSMVRPGRQSFAPASTPAKELTQDDLNKDVVRLMNYMYFIEKTVMIEHDQAKISGAPVTPEGFGGKCNSAFKELYKYLPLMNSDGPIWANE